MMVCMCITIITHLAGSWSNTYSPHSLRCRSDTDGGRKGEHNNWNNILCMCYKNFVHRKGLKLVAGY